jgi:hypothetical protein
VGFFAQRTSFGPPREFLDIAARPVVESHHDQEGIFIAPRKKENSIICNVGCELMAFPLVVRTSRCCRCWMKTVLSLIGSLQLLQNIISLRGGCTSERSNLLILEDRFVAHLPWRAVPEKNKIAPRNDMWMTTL